jgi:hypothetical protein
LRRSVAPRGGSRRALGADAPSERRCGCSSVGGRATRARRNA